MSQQTQTATELFNCLKTLKTSDYFNEPTTDEVNFQASFIDRIKPYVLPIMNNLKRTYIKNLENYDVDIIRDFYGDQIPTRLKTKCALADKRLREMFNDKLHKDFPTPDDYSQALITYREDQLEKILEGPVTGFNAQINKIKGAAAVDLDIPHEYDDELIAKCRSHLQSLLATTGKKLTITDTLHKGFHVWSNVTNDAMNIGRTVQKAVIYLPGTNIIAAHVDIFGPMNPNSRSLVVLPGTYAVDGDVKGYYTFASGDMNQPIEPTLDEVLNALVIRDQVFNDTTVKHTEAKNTDDDNVTTPEDAAIARKHGQKTMTDDECIVVVKGWKGIKGEFHATAHPGKPIKDEATIPHASQFLAACARMGVSPKTIKWAKRFLEDECPKSHNAEVKFSKKMEDGEKMDDERGDEYGCSAGYSILYWHNPEYYEEHYGRIDCNGLELETFLNSEYTIEDFHKEFARFTRPYQMIAKLKLCVAINTHTSEYIVKQRTDGVIQYQSIKRAEFNKSIGTNELVYDTTEDERQKMKEQKKAVKDKMTIKLSHVLSSSLYYDQFEKFNGIDMMSDSSDVLQLYKPPATTNYNEQLVLDWIEFMKSRINNTEAFDELLDSHAYRFRHPTDFIEKFFINYGTGTNCKSYLSACLEKLYPNYANVAVRQDQIENDTFNAWTVRNLLLWIEEVQNSTYQSKSLQQKVKQMTTKQTSTRGMYSETKNGRNWAIVGMNTNSPDLYGLIRADEATISRLVIIDYKKNTMDVDLLRSRCNYFIKHPEFAYSLYHYLATVHKINPKFTPVRYYGDDKRQILERMTMKNKNSVEDWFAECHEDLVKTARVNKVEYKIITEKDANESYATWRMSQTKRLCLNYIKDSMADMGFEYKNQKINGKPVHTWRISTDKYDELIKKLNPIDDDEEDAEEMEIIEDSANNNGIELVQ